MENQIVVLVVEDDQLVQSVVEDCLSDGGFEAVIASSGDNAVELLDASERKYHALVTDINLSPSKFDGWDVARHARQIDPYFPVVPRKRRTTAVGTIFAGDDCDKDDPMRAADNWIKSELQPPK